MCFFASDASVHSEHKYILNPTFASFIIPFDHVILISTIAPRTLILPNPKSTTNLHPMKP